MSTIKTKKKMVEVEQKRTICVDVGGLEGVKKKSNEVDSSHRILVITRHRSKRSRKTTIKERKVR